MKIQCRCFITKMPTTSQTDTNPQPSASEDHEYEWYICEFYSYTAKAGQGLSVAKSYVWQVTWWIFPHCFQDWRVSAVGSGHMFKSRVFEMSGKRGSPLYFSLSVFYLLSVVVCSQCLRQMYSTASFKL